MKKLLAVLCTVTAIAACTAGCAKNPASDKPSNASSAETTQTVTVKQSDYKTAYLEKLDSLQEKYLAENEQTQAEEDVDYGTSDVPGIVFADLFYFDKDETPELFVVFQGKNKSRGISVFTMDDGNCTELLTEELGSGYGETGSNSYFHLSYDNDNNLVLRVDNSNEYKYLNEKYYTLTENGLNTVKLYAESSVGGWGEGENSGPVEPDKFEVDGAKCEKDEFTAKENELHRSESVYVDVLSPEAETVQKKLDTLRRFLSGKTNKYEALSGGFYPTNLSEVAWLNNVNFLFSAK